MRPMTLGVKAVDPATAAKLGAASAAASVLDFVGKGIEWFEQKFLKVPLLPGLSSATTVKKHAKKLFDLMKAQQTIILQEVELPEQLIEGTGFQRLMITVLNDNRTGGLSSVHAEPGVGKSVATAMALRNCTQKSAVTVFLQGDFNGNLKAFFRLGDVADAAPVALQLFRILKERGIRLQMVFDNTFDTGLQGQETKLMALTRAAHEFDHHLIAISQTAEAANEVANLNGARTRKVEQQEPPSYRWSKGRAKEYLKAVNTLTEKDERVLNMTQVRDEVGGWKPVDIKEYLRTGRRPEAPQQGQGGRSTATPAVWVRQLQKDGAGGFEFAGNAFPIDPVPVNVAYLKDAIKTKNPQTVLCDAFQIDIYLQEDGGWTMQTRMGASLRDTDEDDVYGYVLP